MNNFIKFLLVFGLFSISFTACDDDDNYSNDIKKIEPKEVSASYPSMTTDGLTNTLKLTYSGKELFGKSVDFKTDDGRTAKMTLKAILPHEAQTVIENVSLIYNEEKGYTFSGSETSSLGTTFNYNGIVNKGNLLLNIEDVAIPLNELGTLSLVLENKSVSSTGTNDAGKRSRYTTYQQPFCLTTTHPGLQTMEALIGNLILNPLLASVLKNITFGTDGNITALYAPLPDTFDFKADIINNHGIKRTDDDWITSPTNLVSYFITNKNELYLTPNIDMILRQIQQDAKVRSTNTLEGVPEAIKQLKSWITTGIRLTIKENPRKDFYLYKESPTMAQYRKYEGDYIVYIDKEEIKPLIPLIKSLMPILLTPEVLEQLKEQAGGFVDVGYIINILINAIEEAETLEIGLYLNKE